MIRLDIFDDEELICKNCDQIYRLRTGGEPTPFCDVCAQDKVLELAELLRVLRVQRAENERLRTMRSLLQRISNVLDLPPGIGPGVSQFTDEIRTALAETGATGEGTRNAGTKG